MARVLERTSGGVGGMSVGNVLSRGFGAIGGAPFTFFGTSFLLVALPSALMSYAGRAMIGPVALGTDPFASFWLQAVGSGLVWWVLYMAAQAVLFRATASAIEGRAETFGDHAAAAARSLLPLLVLSVLLTLGVAVGWMLLLVPGIMLALMWSVAAPALVAERCGILESFGRSRDLTRGARWRVFGLVLLVFAIYFIASATVGLGNVALNGVAALSPGLASPPLISTVLGVALQTVFVAVWTAIQGALYVELRDWKDGPGGGQLADIFA